MNLNRSVYSRTIIGIVLAGLLSGCGSSHKKGSSEAEGNTTRISVSGAFALYPLVTQWGEEFTKLHPNVKFDIQAGGAGKGMTDVLSGATDIGMFSRVISKAEKEKGVWWVAVTKDAVLPTISTDNPYRKQLHEQGITQQELSSVFLGNEETKWGDIVDIGGAGKKVTVYTRSDASGAAETFASYLGAHQEDIDGVGVMGDPGLADAVRQAPLSMGYNNTIYVYDVDTGHKHAGIDVIPLDLNANGKVDEDESFYDNFDNVLKAIATGKYPSPPARELYLISNGEPQKKAVKDFIDWVLTKGQKFVRPNGYVPLDKDYLKQQDEKLKQ